MYCAINPTIEVVRLNANATRLNPNLQDIVEIQEYQAQLLGLSRSCAPFPSNANNGLNTMGGRLQHDGSPGWQPNYVNTKRIMYPLCVELERRRINTSEYYFSNGEIPLSSFINLEQQRRECVEKTNSFVIRQHCREDASSSLEDADSPTSSSTTFMSSNESSNFSSSSGQSSDSVNASEGYRRRLIRNERQDEQQQHFYDKQTDQETNTKPHYFNRTNTTVSHPISETIRPRTRMHKGDLQSQLKSSAKCQRANYIDNAPVKNHCQPMYRSNKTIYVNCLGSRQNKEDLAGDPIIGNSKNRHHIDMQRENKHTLQKKHVVQANRKHDFPLKERTEKFEQLCQTPAAENSTRKGYHQTKPKSQGKHFVNHTNQGSTCRLKEDLKLGCKHLAKSTVSCPKASNEHGKKTKGADGKGKVK